MKNNFTTPSFAKMLKEHGIEIETPFMWHYPFLANTNGYHLIVSEGNYTSFDIDNDNVSMVILGFYECESKVEVLPAYLLTEVLGWLPKAISMQGDYYELILNFDTRGNLTASYYDDQMGSLYDGERGIYYKADSIEALITQGLTEGWLTKDNLNVNS